MKTLTQAKFLDFLLKDKKKYKQFALQVEDRSKRWKYGIRNHAEFIGYMNPHDKCLWDALIPGYKQALTPDDTYKLKQVIGVFMLENGNHKIVCKIYKPGYNATQAEKDTKTYMRRYYKQHGLKSAWIQIGDF